MLALGLAGCDSLPLPAGFGQVETATLPPDATDGARDPMRQAITETSLAFASQSRLAGRPVLAARAVAEMEFLRVELLTNPRLTSGNATASTVFPAAQREWRGALGIVEAAAPQEVIDRLFGAARALSAGQEGAAAAALSSPIFSLGPTVTLQRLAALPPLPISNQAAQEATRTFSRRFNRF
jgi:hypothetical protein